MTETEIAKKQYILHYITKPDFASEEELHNVRQFINEKVTALGGTIEASLCQDNARRLAYPIKKCERGYFCETAFLLDPERVKELYDNLRLDPVILRYVIGFKPKATKNRPLRRRTPLVLEGKAEMPPQNQQNTQTVPPQAETREKISIEELDKKLDEIIKNI